ncbi:MFS transporter [Anaerosalibacter massiliensis]|uniref:MFS transporter n=1 Tax=Anaerosalibacter massiliensis TaxID=1347392 RepID=A0A9X2MIB4_9FIRM|nr:MFS transporter [Anaerosalibacter massiliensis]MCR2044194.1 MFS transporter [Anaerosalibacter massiliensis]
MNTNLVRQKDFFLLMLGKLVSLLGSNMQQFALSLYVLEITGSATIFASMLSISIIPRILLSPMAGVFGDWFDRKKTIVILDILNAVIIGIYAIIFIINESFSLSMIYLLVILLEVTEIFFGSAMSAVLPSMVDREELLDANSLNSLVMNIGQLLAPIIGAIIYESFGLKLVLIINSISFLASGISEMFIDIPKKHKKPDKISIKLFKNDLMEGIDIIKGNKFIFTMISLGTIINFAIAPLFSVGLIFIIKEVLKATDFQFGVFQMVLSVSMIVAPILCSGYIKRIPIGKLSYISFILVGLLVLIMAPIPSSIMINNFSLNFIYVLLLTVSFIIGVLATVSNIAIGTIFNQVTPIEFMGRTSTVFNLAVTIFIPAGQMIFGFLYDIISPSYVIAISSIIMIVVVRIYKTALMDIDMEKTEITGDVINEI